jgi:hypothetical protein
MATASIPSAAEIAIDSHYEVVNGETVALPPMGIYETWIASILHAHLDPFRSGNWD